MIDEYVGYVDSTERVLRLGLDSKGINVYFSINNSMQERIWICCKGAGFDQYGAVHLLDNSNTLRVWSYDLTPDMNSVIFTAYATDVESLLFKGSGEEAILTGYKTLSGETCSLPTFTQIKEIVGMSNSSIPEPSYNPFPSTPAQATSTPKPTERPVVAKPNSIVPRMSIKTSKSAISIYEGKKLVSKSTLKKGTLTWKRWVEKTKHYKSVKCAGSIKKSKNFVYITKKGSAYTVSFKTGKKKRIVKKGAKKLVKSKGFVISIKTGSRKVNVKNK